jgi:methanogenic corrinoid protein MtbC1
MKKSSVQLRKDIAKLQDQLRQAETREAERIGRIALRAGLGEIEIDEGELQAAFETVANRFRDGQRSSKSDAGGGEAKGVEATNGSGSSSSQPQEA